MRQTLTLIVAMLLVLPGPAAFAGGKDPASLVPDVTAIGYFSHMAPAKGEFAKNRHRMAKTGVDQAEKEPAQGGLGIRAGFRNVEKPEHWTEFVIYCGGKEEAEALLPALRQGWVALVLTDRAEKVWHYGPTFLNGPEDTLKQIAFAMSEHERLNPDTPRFVVVTPTPPPPAPPPAPALLASSQPATPATVPTTTAPANNTTVASTSVKRE
jgi:hypothetical protein